ncbi:hypothetical protein [Hydrogenophaga sp. 5NK40-0174]|uniref:hypothetical protein n=1 Tax=Hydrogenophaga sp. 5NK40-0174 TaxID=3127649 RepID=UPI00310C6A24
MRSLRCGKVGELKAIELLFIVVLLAVTACTSRQPESTPLPLRPGVKAFDASKVAQLSAERRAALEQELFSELQVWNMGSRQYPDQAGIAAREQRWQAMADEGLELAHITLTVLEPRTGKAHELTPAIKRLEVLAEQGDAGAMCLIDRLVNVTAAQLDWKQYEATARKWLERGAELGHPECLISLGGRTLRGVGYTKDTARGLELIFRGRKAGYAHGVGSLILFYKSKGFEDDANVKRLYCWMVMEDRFYFRDPIDEIARMMRKQSNSLYEHNRETLSELAAWEPNLQDCVDLGKGE